MTEWNLRSRSHACHQCAAVFADGERCFSCVAPFSAPVVQTIFAEKIAAQAAEGKTVKNPDYVRLDFCPACWESKRSLAWISMWHSPYAAPEAVAPEPLPRETAESILRKHLEGPPNAGIKAIGESPAERADALLKNGKLDFGVGSPTESDRKVIITLIERCL